MLTLSSRFIEQAEGTGNDSVSLGNTLLLGNTLSGKDLCHIIHL
jgi:hypothetical protein